MYRIQPFSILYTLSSIVLFITCIHLLQVVILLHIIVTTSVIAYPVVVILK
jgi:hypothetical protein